MVETYMHLRWMKVLYGLVLCAISLPAMGQVDIQKSQVMISFSCGPGCLWEYAQQGSAYHFSPPTFSIDGKQISAMIRRFTPVGTPTHLDNGATEYIFAGTLGQASPLHLGV